MIQPARMDAFLLKMQRRLVPADFAELNRSAEACRRGDESFEKFTLLARQLGQRVHNLRLYYDSERPLLSAEEQASMDQLRTRMMEEDFLQYFQNYVRGFKKTHTLSLETLRQKSESLCSRPYNVRYSDWHRRVISVDAIRQGVDRYGHLSTEQRKVYVKEHPEVCLILVEYNKIVEQRTKYLVARRRKRTREQHRAERLRGEAGEEEESGPPRKRRKMSNLPFFRSAAFQTRFEGLMRSNHMRYSDEVSGFVQKAVRKRVEAACEDLTSLASMRFSPPTEMVGRHGWVNVAASELFYRNDRDRQGVEVEKIREENRIRELQAKLGRKGDPSRDRHRAEEAERKRMERTNTLALSMIGKKGGSSSTTGMFASALSDAPGQSVPTAQNPRRPTRQAHSITTNVCHGYLQNRLQIWSGPCPRWKQQPPQRRAPVNPLTLYRLSLFGDREDFPRPEQEE